MFISFRWWIMKYCRTVKLGFINHHTIQEREEEVEYHGFYIWSIHMITCVTQQDVMLWWYDGICCARITVACFEPNFKVHSCQRINAHIHYTHPPNAQKVKSLNATICAQLNGLISIFKTCVLNVDLVFLECNTSRGYY